MKYSATLTGASFLFFELKKVAQLSMDGLTVNEIKQEVIDENLFEYKLISSLKRALPSLLRRTNILDNELKTMLLNDELQTAKAITLYAIMKTDRLFFEWMSEVISEKLLQGDFLLEKKDVNLFFAHKAEQSPKVASFTEQTVRKLQTVHGNILFESGILSDKKSGTIKRLLIDEDLRNHLRYIGDIAYLKAMGDDERY